MRCTCSCSRTNDDRKIFRRTAGAERDTIRWMIESHLARPIFWPWSEGGATRVAAYAFFPRERNRRTRYPIPVSVRMMLAGSGASAALEESAVNRYLVYSDELLRKLTVPTRQPPSR